MLVQSVSYISKSWIYSKTFYDKIYLYFLRNIFKNSFLKKKFFYWNEISELICKSIFLIILFLMILICILIVSKFNGNWNISEWIYVSILSNL